MSNTTQPQDNITVSQQYEGQVVIGLYGFLTVSPCLVFLFINGVMLFSLRSKPVFRETSRYILLYNLLFADTFVLAVGQLLYILAIARLYMIRYICLFIAMFGMISTRISSLNLAVMSLERYVAVCFPLRHADIATIKTTFVAIAVVWLLCSINTLIRIFMLLVLESIPMGQLMQDFCSKEKIFQLKIFADMEKAFTCITFISVGVLILWSYIGVMMAAKTASSNKASNSKARRTVLLHLVQLFLILSSSLVSTILSALNGKVDRITMVRIRFVLFVTLVNLPRCLSCLIYGLRDQTIRPILMYHLSFGLRRSVMPASIKP